MGPNGIMKKVLLAITEADASIDFIVEPNWNSKTIPFI
jgi:hypothetical protein